MLHVDYITTAEVEQAIAEYADDQLWSKALRIGEAEYYSDLHLWTAQRFQSESSRYSEEVLVVFSEDIWAECEQEVESHMCTLDFYIQCAYENLAA